LITLFITAYQAWIYQYISLNFRDILKEILGRENIMLFVFGDHGMTLNGM